MPDCKICGGHFPQWITIDGRKRNLQHRRFCLDCSPFGKHARSIRRTRARVNIDGLIDCECSECGKSFKSDCNRTRCPSCSVNRHRKIRRLKSIAYKGGCCVLCGYKRCVNSMVFHHTDPALKEFDLSSQHSISWDKCKEELDKCVLLCANCHGEVHAGLVVLGL